MPEHRLQRTREAYVFVCPSCGTSLPEGALFVNPCCEEAFQQGHILDEVHPHEIARFEDEGNPHG